MKLLDLESLTTIDTDLLPDPWQGRDTRDLESSDKASPFEAELSLYRRPIARTTVDATAAKLAREAITRLPEPGETIHLIVSGRFPFSALLPATLELAEPAIIEDCQISTLSFSANNGIELATLLDAGKIKRLTLIAAEVFAARSPNIYDDVAKAITDRGQRCICCRTHCKIINFRLSDGRTYSAEGSCNLRSAKSLENITFTCDPYLYQFHRDWIEATTEKQKDRK